MNLLDFYIPEEVLVALSLLILLVFLRRFLWKPVMKVIDDRQKGVDDMLQKAEEAQKIIDEMEKQRATHEADLSRREVELMNEARTRAGLEHDRIIADARDRAREIVEAGEQKAKRAYEQSMSESRETVITLALGAA
jgi:F-type H+-transporting ATPase subunit b